MTQRAVIRDGYGLLGLTGIGDDWNQDGTNGTVLDNMVTADYVHLHTGYQPVTVNGSNDTDSDNHLDMIGTNDDKRNHAGTRRKASAMGRILKKTLKRRRSR